MQNFIQFRMHNITSVTSLLGVGWWPGAREVLTKNVVYDFKHFMSLFVKSPGYCYGFYFVMLTRVCKMIRNDKETEFRVYKRQDRNFSKKWRFRIGGVVISEKKNSADIGNSPKRSINSIISRKYTIMWAVHKCVSGKEDFRTEGT
jgi:hypothetical protein